MKQKSLPILILLTSLMLCLSAAFSPADLVQQAPIFFDDFEEYLNASQLKTAYTVWEDGALLNIAMDRGHVFSGGKSMRVDVLGPNPQTLSTSASIYHLLQLSESNWTEGAGVRFWVHNLSRIPLSMTFNFKERRNEFWSIADHSTVYLQNSENSYLQQEGQYGNIIIPAFFKGFLYIPFESFSVPAWNTAKGDELLNLAQIESFSFGINITTTELQRFYIDDIEILPQSNFNIAQLAGQSKIAIPASGQHREFYTLLLPELHQDPFLPVQWELITSNDKGLVMNNDGWLTVPAGTSPGTVTLCACLPADLGLSQIHFEVSLFDPTQGDEPIIKEVPVSDEIKIIEEENSAYLQFADQLESWVSTHRALFVLITVTGIVVIIMGLSFLQNRLK
jgi:hypothetical protein